jgi:pyridoxine 5-phosphate synthase
MAAVDEIIEIARDVQPELATLVPEKRQELTTEGGLNVVDDLEKLKDAIERLHEKGILVSLFVEPDIEQIDAARGIDADMIEIHTGNYANAETEIDTFTELDKIKLAVTHAKKIGLGVNAGHGLNYTNIADFLEVEGVDEVSIGQAIIARAVFVGLEKAITEMKNLIK